MILKVRICVTKFLPTIFVDAMKQNPEAAVAMLDSEHENPELIWNEETRAKVARVVAEVGNSLLLSLLSKTLIFPGGKHTVPTATKPARPCLVPTRSFPFVT